MELNISRSSITRVIAVLLGLAILLGGGYFAWSNGLPQQLFSSHQKAGFTPAAEPAIRSLKSFYSPDTSLDESAWESLVCEGMTEQGCELFRKIYAPAIWKMAQTKPLSATVEYRSSVDTLKDGSQIWKVRITTATQTSTNIYIHVAQNETGKWFLNRVLFAQEAEKYENQ
jgi:hypothetical protein